MPFNWLSHRFNSWKEFFSRFGGILIWYRANLCYGLKSASARRVLCKTPRGGWSRAVWDTLVTYWPLLAWGKPMPKSWFGPDEAGIVWILTFPDASRMTKDPVGLYSFTTLPDARDRNRSQTNRLVYAVMPITERRRRLNVSTRSC